VAVVVVTVFFGRWIYNYLCNQYLSPLMLWVRPRSGEVNSIQHYVIKLVRDLRQVGGFLRFPPPQNWPLRY